MQHSHASELDSEGQHALWQALKYPLLAVVTIIAVFELSAGMLVSISIAVGLVYALTERVKKIDEQEYDRSIHYRFIGDGGSFPNDRPEMKKVHSQPASIMDGGSFERHRIR